VIVGENRADSVRLTAQALGLENDLVTAAFIVAQELGEIDGDVVVLDAQGRVIRDKVTEHRQPDRRQEPG
jgi:hypothetical protein